MGPARSFPKKQSLDRIREEEGSLYFVESRLFFCEAVLSQYRQGVQGAVSTGRKINSVGKIERFQQVKQCLSAPNTSREDSSSESHKALFLGLDGVRT